MNSGAQDAVHPYFGRFMAVNRAQRATHTVPGLCMLHRSGKRMVQYQTFVFGKERRNGSRMGT